MKKTHRPSVSASFRQKAEALLKEKASAEFSQLSDTDIMKLIHELEVH